MSSCLQLESVSLYNGIFTLPPGVYEVTDLQNRTEIDNVILRATDGTIVIDEDTIAISSGVLKGLTSIIVGEGVDLFSYEDGMLVYNGGESPRLVAVVSGVTSVTDGSFEIIDGGVFAQSDITELVIAEGVTVGDTVFDGLTQDIVVYIYCDPSALDISATSFAGSSGKVRFYVTPEIYDAFGPYLRSIGDVLVGTYGEGYEVYTEPMVGDDITVTVTEGSISDGTYTAEVSFTGGYTLHDVIVLVNGVETDVDDGISIVLEDAITTISFALRERVGDNPVTVTFVGNGGTSDGSETVSIQIAPGLTIVDSEIPEFVYDSHTLVGWSTYAGSSYDFDVQVMDNLVLYAVWEQRDPMITVDTNAGDVYIDGVLADGPVEVGLGEEVTLTVELYGHNEFIGWSYTVDGETVESEDEELRLTVTGDVTVSVEYRYVAISAGSNNITHQGMPTTEEILDSVMIGSTTNKLDTSGMYWLGHVSVPLIVDNTVYFRSWSAIYAMESDTGHIYASAPSSSTANYYHQLSYGDGLIVDTVTGRVYDLDLNLQFTLSNTNVIGVYEYYDGYFYSIGTTVYRFSTTDRSAVNAYGVMQREEVGTFPKSHYSSYGLTASVFVDGYIYRIYYDGKEIGIMAMCIDDSSEEYGETSYYNMTDLYGYLLDDGWLTYYEGTLFLTGYGTGLFNNVAVLTDDRIAWVDVDGLEFSNYGYYEIEGAKSFTSQFIIYNDRGYINAGPSFYVFDVGRGENGVEIEVIDSIETAAGHGGITIDVSYDGAVYAYFIPYQGGFKYGGLTVIKDSLLDGEGTLSSVSSIYSYGYNSQAVRADRDGRMIWYNDNGPIYTVTTADKNVFYIFIQDGDSAIWYEAYGKTPADAVSSLGEDVATIGEFGNLESVNGQDADGWAMYVLENGSITIDGYEGSYWDPYENFYDSSGQRHYIVITDGDVPDNGTVFYYIQDGEVLEYTFAENVGDRSIAGTNLYTETPVAVTDVKLDISESNLQVGGSVSITATVEPAHATDSSVTWASNNTLVAVVDEEGNVTAVGAGSAIITATAGGVSATCTVTVTGTASITVQGPSRMEAGETYVFTATNASGSSPSVRWTSSDTSVATVDSNGNVTAVGVGTVVIMATASNGDYGSVTVSVSGSLSVSPTSVSVYMGSTASFVVTVRGYDPEGFVVTSSNSGVVGIDEVTYGTDTLTVTVSGLELSYGTVDVAVYYRTDSSVSVIVPVSVEERPPYESDYTITIRVESYLTEDLRYISENYDVEESLLIEGFTYTVTATNAGEALEKLCDENGIPANFYSDDTLKYWISDMYGLGDVSHDDGAWTYWTQYHLEDGVWVYNNWTLGYYTDGGSFLIVRSTTYEEDVEGGGSSTGDGSSSGTDPTGVSLDRTSVSLEIGDTVGITATLTPAGATGGVNWTSSDTSVATVDSSGNVTAVGVGSTVITATTSNGLTAQCTVTVLAAPSLSVETTVDASGSAVLTEEQLASILNVVASDEDAVVRIVVSGAVDRFELTIPSIMGELAEAGVEIRVQSDVGDIVLDADTVAALAGENLVVSVARADGSDVAAELPEGSTLYSVDITLDDDAVSSLGGSATISLPFDIGSADPSDIRVWYVDGDTLTEVPAGYSAGRAEFSTDHLSMWAVGIEASSDEPGTDAPGTEGDDEGGNAWVYVAALVVVIVIVAAAVLIWRRGKA